MWLPSLALEAVFDAYLEVASPRDEVSVARRRRWLAQHALLAFVPEFCRAARRFAQRRLPALPSRDGAAVAPWEGCDLGAPHLRGAGTLTVVGSRDCGGKNAAACDVVASMRGQLDRLYVARISPRPSAAAGCHGAAAHLDCYCGVAPMTTVLCCAAGSDAIDEVNAIVDGRRCRREGVPVESIAILIEACDRYFGRNPAARDRDLARLLDGVAAAKRRGIHVVATTSGVGDIGACPLVDATDRFVLVVPDVGRRDDVARLFAPLAHCLPHALAALMATAGRYDGFVFERGSAVSLWARGRPCR